MKRLNKANLTTEKHAAELLLKANREEFYELKGAIDNYEELFRKYWNAYMGKKPQMIIERTEKWVNEALDNIHSICNKHRDLINGLMFPELTTENKKENNNTEEASEMNATNNTIANNNRKEEEDMVIMTETEQPLELRLDSWHRFVRGWTVTVNGKKYNLIIVMFVGTTSCTELPTWISYYKEADESWDDLKYMAEELVTDYNLAEFLDDSISGLYID